MKKITVALVIIILAGAGIYMLMQSPSGGENLLQQPISTASTTTPSTNQPSEVVYGGASVIGKSVEGRDIISYRYGTGTTELLFVGGIHGGYEWNTALVAYQLMDYLKANPSIVPANLTVTVIPVLNPDGLVKVVGTTSPFKATDVSKSESTVIAGRFNANTVDLNRNFDCDWKAAGVWQDKAVSGGTKAFSEPESQAIKNYVDANKPAAAVVWYSAAGGVYASNCHAGILPETRTILGKYATASGYPAFDNFDFYVTTGDMVNWLAKNNVPAISVLLTNHTDTEWTKNKAGVDALIKHYAK